MNDSDVKPWTSAEVATQLAKVLNNPEFERNRSVSAFLKFVVDETLGGRGPRLKAFTVAMAVFNRDVNFDPQNNSIVRVQAARLRQLLQIYYSGPGARDSIRITMPLGGYAVEFKKNHVGYQEAAETNPAGPSAEKVVALAGDSGLPAFFAADDGGECLSQPRSADAPIGAANDLPPAVIDGGVDRPVLVLHDGPANSPGAKHQALRTRLRDTIERGISAFDHVLLLQRLGVSPPKLSYSMIMESGEEDDGGLWFSYKLFHYLSGSLIWSRGFSDVEASSAAVAQVAISVVRAVADVYGAINADAMFRCRSEMENPRGYFCLRAAFDVFKDPTPEKEARARDCLEAECAETPDDARILSLLSDYLVRRYIDAAPKNLGAEDLRRASRLARRAYDLAPQRAQPIYAMFLTRFHDKRFEDAFIAAKKALEINPNSSIMTAQIGAAYILRGQYQRGEALLAGMMDLEQAPPASLGAYLALVAYMRGDDARFHELCRSSGLEGGAIGLLLQIVSSHKSQDASSLHNAVVLLPVKFPGVATDIPAALDRYAAIREIQAKLLGDLALAGLIDGP